MEYSIQKGPSPCEKTTGTRFSNPTYQIKTSDSVDAQNKRVLPSLELHNNAYMFLCPIEAFLDHYGPYRVKPAELNRCVVQCLLEEDPILLRGDHGRYVWADLRTLSTNRGMPGSKMFEPLKRIVVSVMTGNKNSLRLNHALNFHITSTSPASTHVIDACFIEGVNMGSPLKCAETNAPEEIERYRTRLSRRALSKSHAQLQIVGACHETLSQDPRRMWIYSLMFENSLVSMWYFSRTHSVKSVAFDWVQNPDIFIRVLLGFAKASQHQLGIDPTIHLGPSIEHGTTRSYVYEVPGAEDQPLFFKTLQSLTSEPSACIAGRTTRVWEAMQVTSADGKVQVNGKKVVLKDVWLEATEEPVRTETDNMDTLFRDVDTFVRMGLDREINNEMRKNPMLPREALISDPDTMERLMTQFIGNERRFRTFDDAAKKRMRENLTDKKYRSMFLTKLYTWRGVKCRNIDPEASPFPRMFFSWPLEPDAIDALLEEERWDQRVKRDSQYDQQAVDHSHSFVPRQQHRFIYEEVCTTLQNLHTVGDVVDVLCQTIDVLSVFLAAGWVHRDISANNIMAYRATRDRPWVVKLADLEFARPMTGESLSNLRVGTPFFMPVEMSTQLHLFTWHPGCRVRSGHTLADELCVKKEEAPEGYKHLSHISPLLFFPSKVRLPSNPLWSQVPHPTSPVMHNLQHDLESIWWILVWIITCRVGCEKSANAAAKYFKSDMNDCVARARLLSTNMSAIESALDKKLHDVGPLVEPLRRELVQHYITRAIFGHINLPGSYYSIHAAFATKFRHIQAKEGLWRDMKLQRDKAGPEVVGEMAGSADHPASTGKHRRDSSEFNTCVRNKQPLDSADKALVY